MSTTKSHDLTGRWTGVYFYPVHAEWNPHDVLPPTAFTAEIKGTEGHITGQTFEIDRINSVAPSPVEADIDGHTFGGDLFFTKYPGGGRTHTIDYNGQISADGNSVSGQWVIHGHWSGEFRMQRRVSPAKVVTRITADTRA